MSSLLLLGAGTDASAGGGGLSPVVHQAADSTPTFCNNAVPSNSSAITVPASLTNGLLLVGVEWDGGSAVGVTAVTWNGTAMEKVTSQLTSDNATLIEIWGLRNPASGTNTLAFTWNGGTNTATTRAQFCGSSYSNVKQTGGTSTYGSAVTPATGTGATASISVTDAGTNGQIVAMHGATLANISAVNQTTLGTFSGTNAAFGMNRAQANGGAQSFTATWSGSANWASIAVDLQPAA